VLFSTPHASWNVQLMAGTGATTLDLRDSKLGVTNTKAQQEPGFLVMMELP
jgi:hypothetical protein